MGHSTPVSAAILRERTQNALQKLGVSDSDDLAALPADKRSSAASLLERQARIESLFSPMRQIEEFGELAWNNKFVLLRQCTSGAGTSLRDSALQEEIWRNLPDSRFKRFQELFSDQQWRIVPSFHFRLNGQIEFETPAKFDQTTVKGCIVNPERISDALATALGLADFTQDRGDPAQRLLKKADPDTILLLKKIWDTARPIERQNHRIFVIGEATPALEAAYPGSPAVNRSLAGTLLYISRRENGLNRDDEPRVNHSDSRKPEVQHFSNAYAAHRKTMHQSHSYHDEIDKLAVIKEEIKHFIGELDQRWRRGVLPATKAELIERANKLAVQANDSFSACRNTYKIEGREFVLGSAAFQDKSGKENVSSSMAKLVAAISRFEDRFVEMSPMGGFNKRDEMDLQNLITAHEHTMRRFRVEFAREAPRIKIESDADSAIGTLGESIRALGQMTLQPFIGYRHRIDDVYAGLASSNSGKTSSMVKDAVVRLDTLDKLYAAQVCFEHLKLATLRTPLRGAVTSEKLIDGLERALRGNESAAGHSLPECDDVVAELISRVTDLRAVLSKRLVGAAYDHEIHHQVKAILDRNNFESMQTRIA